MKSHNKPQGTLTLREVIDDFRQSQSQPRKPPRPVQLKPEPMAPARR